MANQFDTFLEGQKKAFDFWSETSKKMINTVSETFSPVQKQEDFLGSWFNAQKKIWEEATKFTDLKDAYEKTPEQLQQWAKMQTEFAQQWMDFYSQNANRFGIKMPPVNGYAKPYLFSQSPQEWTEWVEKANQFWQNTLMMKLPSPQNFHFQNFNDMYKNMQQFWEPMQRMIEHGITDWKGIGMFMKMEDYQKIVGQFMGMNPITNVTDLLQQANDMFEQTAGWMEDFSEGMKETQSQWKSIMGNTSEWKPGHMLQVVLSLNEAVQDNLESMYNMAGQNKEVEMARLIKDIQFTYIAFILRSAEMQGKVMQAGQFALPDTIRLFSEKVKTEKQLPDYQSFFNGYVGVLEKYMTEVLESKDYSQLQNEVAKSGVTVKSKMDQLVELAFSDFPFLMKSHADEVAIENRALRKKLRSLEQRMAALEAGPAAQAPAQGNGLNDALLAGIGRADVSQRDDLKQIKGIGPKLEEMLNSIGILTFEQVSKMTKQHYTMVDELLAAFQGRALRDEWAKQAKTLRSK
ncbi:MAG: poly(R)-hydroxyalkanoic acid synthase subunit PhaE [Bacteroidota bacterium]